ncbi:MAG TPA: hypothetical protein VGJ81_09760 [Thermoanaerobaculia bacterium]
MTFLLFLTLAGAIVFAWNRSFQPVPPLVTAVFLIIVCGYQASTLFTERVDVAGGLSAGVYPWKAAPHPQVNANTGIVPTQLVPRRSP